MIRSYIKGEDYKLYWNEKKIPANEISEIYIEKSEINVPKTILLVIGVAALVVVLVFIISIASDPDAFSVGGFR